MRFIQLWIMPTERGLSPSLEQKVFTEQDRTDLLLEVLSPDGGKAVKVHGDARVFVSRLNPGTEVTHSLGPGRGAYLYLIEGALRTGEEKLGTGDAAKVRDEEALRLAADDTTELLLVDVPLD
jgi:redox-sensitive bicupin YhaK (pirin superfamily)